MTPRHLRRALALLLLFAGGVMFLMQPRSSLQVEPGDSLGEVHAELASGRAFDLAEHRGKPLVLNFWATWCGPCRQEAPELNRLHDSGVEVIGLAVDTLPLPEIARKAQQIGIRYPVGKGSPGLAERLGISSVPTTCVVGGDGKLIESHLGYSSFEQLHAAVAAAGRP